MSPNCRRAGWSCRCCGGWRTPWEIGATSGSWRPTTSRISDRTRQNDPALGAGGSEWVGPACSDNSTVTICLWFRLAQVSRGIIASCTECRLGPTGAARTRRTGDDMTRDSAQSRRLRVSALAAVANPSYTRIDTWNQLDDACHQLAVVDRAGMDTAHEAARGRRLLNRLSASERYWIYPGPENLATYCSYLDQLATVSLAEQVSLAVRLLSEYGDRAALFDTSSSLADQELVSRAKEQQFYTV